jgi:hypothetical protein
MCVCIYIYINIYIYMLHIHTHTQEKLSAEACSPFENSNSRDTCIYDSRDICIYVYFNICEYNITHVMQCTQDGLCFLQSFMRVRAM